MRLRGDSGGNVALEYALAGPLFLALLTGILYIALADVGQSGLETATESAARLVMTGLAQSGSVRNAANGTDVGMTAADFKNAICHGVMVTEQDGTVVSIARMLPPFLVCSRLTVIVAPAAYGQSALALHYNGNGTLNTGTNSGYTPSPAGGGQNQVMMVQLIYDWPTFNGQFGLNLANEHNGTRRLVATSVFTTEAYSCAATQPSC
jgi:Flp pilus assembly protein TadG